MTNRRLANALMAGYDRGMMPEGSYNAASPFGVDRRPYLYDGEMYYFRENPHVAGMAAEDDRVILNPYSPNTQQEQNSVALNEQSRVFMRNNPLLAPSFGLLPSQAEPFAGTAYDKNPQAIRETLAARLLTGDPSAGQPTKAQSGYVNRLGRLARTTNK
jgi:hypothetical protein